MRHEVGPTFPLLTPAADRFARRHPALLVAGLALLAALGFALCAVESGRSVLVYQGF